MRRQAVARREKERRRPHLCLPRVRQKVLRRQRNLPRIVEVDDADDRENDNADYAGLPELGVSWILGIDQKIAQFWWDRCLDAIQKWSAKSTLSKHVWIDEMRFAPTRASGFVDGVWSTYAGKIAKDAYLEVAFDCGGSGFCRLYAEKLGTPKSHTFAESFKKTLKWS